MTHPVRQLLPGALAGYSTCLVAPLLLSFLLGLDWGQLPDRAVVYEPGADGRPLATDQFVELNSGMMCVVPMWTIARVLYSQELEAKRTWIEARLHDDQRRLPPITGSGAPDP